MSKVLVDKPLEYFTSIDRIQFEINLNNQHFESSIEEKELLKNYLKTSSIYVYSNLVSLVNNNPDFMPKLTAFNHLVPSCSKLNDKDLLVFMNLINRQKTDRKLTVYRGTSKAYFTATNLINNDPFLSFENIKQGDTIKPLTVSSTSLDVFISNDFCCGGEHDYLLIEYELESGSNLFWGSPFSGFKEREFILPPGSEFNVDEIDNATLTKYLPPSDDINYIKVRKIK